ncbi:hypothetical protein EDD11_010310, partial [Mortierella claussenii]
MALTSTTEKPRQAFQICAAADLCPLTAAIIHVDTQHDSMTGEQIVLWKHILHVFKKMDYILEDTAAVSFMVDKDTFEDLVPLRIKHRPGVILKVIMQEAGSVARHASTASAISIAAHSNDGHFNTNVNPGTTQSQPSIGNALKVDYEVTPEHLELLSISDAAPAIPSYGHNHISLSTQPCGDVPSSVQQSNPLYNDTRQAFAANQAQQAAVIAKEGTRTIDAMNEQFGQHRVDSEEIKVLQSAVLQMQQEMIQMQKQMDQKHKEVIQMQNQMDKKQQELNRRQDILQMQRQTFSRQSRIQAALTQTYELHERPRFFIVLPKAAIQRWGKPFTKQFRLFFLCECGDPTQTPGSKVLHTIHLVKHKGYDLDRPSEFFKKYGAYVLTLLEMLKYGVTTARIAVPPLASLDHSEWLDNVKDVLHASGCGLESLVDSSISYIQEQETLLDKDGVLSESEEGHRQQLNKLEIMEGADLNMLGKYLKTRDEGFTPDNWYRIVTCEGHVKWVCVDHYRENYQPPSLEQLKKVIAVSNGTFNEQKGKIIIRLSSPALANEFYGIIAKTRGIQILDVALAWDATHQELRDFAAAMTKANIARLKLDGRHLKGPALDVVNHGRRFNPLVQLLCNGRIQSIT